jgi:Sec-independent protein translocase protein TatA
MYNDGGFTQLFVLALGIGLVLKPQDLPRAAHFVGRLCGRTVALVRELRQGATQLARLVEEEEGGVSAKASRQGASPEKHVNAFQLHRELQESAAELRQLRILLRREWNAATPMAQVRLPTAMVQSYRPRRRLPAAQKTTESGTAEDAGADLVLRALEERAFADKVQHVLDAATVSSSASSETNRH